MNKQAKAVRDGKVAVLISPRFGPGWSTRRDNARHRMWCLYAPEVVAWVEAGKPGWVMRVQELAHAHSGEDAADCSAGMDLEIEWLPIGTKFRVTEQNGSEEIELADDMEWDIASADPVQATEGGA